MNNSFRKYISTTELRNQLQSFGHSVSVQQFRNKIIAALRDSQVIIVSCKKGYKIPTNKSELFDFVNHDKSILIPMLQRLNKCRNIIKLGTDNNVDILENEKDGILEKLIAVLV